MKNFRTSVFKRAYLIMNQTGRNFAACLVEAWQLYRLAKDMKKGQVQFYYKKIDGSIRKAVGTLKDIDFLILNKKSSSPKVFVYFDVDMQDFRAFRIENYLPNYKEQNITPAAPGFNYIYVPLKIA